VTSGYNALTHFNNTVGSLTCNLAQPCNATQFQVAAATIGSAPKCNTTRVCSALEYQTVAPTYTSDRACATLRVCQYFEYQTVAATATSNRQCQLIQYDPLYPVHLVADVSTGIVPISAQPLSPTEYSFSMLSLVRSGASGAVNVSVGSLAVSAVIDSTLSTPVTLNAVLISTDVWFDASAVYVSFHALDAFGNIGSSAMVSASMASASTDVSATCMTSSLNGTCTAVLSPPDNWFTGDLDFVANISYGFMGQAQLVLGSVIVHQRIIAMPGGDVFVVRLPQHDLDGVSSVMIPVTAISEYLINTFTLKMVLDSRFIFEGVSIDTSIWTGDIVSENNTIALAYIRSDARSAHHNASASEQQLFSVNVRVSSAVLQSTQLSVAVEVLYASDVNDNIIFADAVPAVVISRDGTSVNGSANMYFVKDTLVGLFAFASEADLVNTAVLSNVAVFSTITVIGVYSTSKTSALSSSLSCMSSQPSIVQVDAQCRMVMLLGSETSGGLVSRL